LSRREFLRISSLIGAGTIVAACAPTPATPTEPGEPTAPAEPTEPTAEPAEQPTEPVAPTGFAESPLLADMGLPPVEGRLPVNPPVIEPWEEVGEYGGTWRQLNQRDDFANEALQFYEQLLRFSMYDYATVPNVAESWEVSEDGLTFTFHLLEGIKWSDGEPLTSEDILFGVNDVYGNADLYQAYPTWLRAGEERPTVTASDDYTVSFEFPQPPAFFERHMGRATRHVIRPKHYLEQFHAEYADEADLNAKVSAAGFSSWTELFLNRVDYNFNEEIPVIFAWKRESTQTDGATYVRNPYYWKVDTQGNQLPYIDQVQVQKVASTEVAQLAQFSGENDLTLFVVGQFPRDTMVLLENEEVGGYHVIQAPIGEPNVLCMGVNLTHQDPVLKEIFNDRRFRFALSHAINREDIRQLIYLGQPQEIRQVAPLPVSPYYSEAAAYSHVEFDLDQANAYLDEMGLTEKNADGIRLRPDGQPIEIVIETHSFRDDFLEIAELISGWWTSIGIAATSKGVEGTLFTTRMQSGELDCGITFAGPGIYTPISPSRQIPSEPNSIWAPLWGLWYASGGASGEEPPEEVQQQLALYDELSATVDQSRQVELWNQIMEINAENLYQWGICDRAAVPVPVTNRFHNVPEEGWDCDWDAGNIGTTHPEQYFIRE
ncbi:MAG: hypothetical protein GX649_12655, partial [Chloroflexi bacterium]|nr:hypothetical protein [Chloroflexota bacterium]